MDAPAASGKNSTFTICGENPNPEKLYFNAIRWKLTEYGLNNKIPIEKVYVPGHGSHCFEANIYIDYIYEKGLGVYFAMDGNFAVMGCVTAYVYNDDTDDSDDNDDQKFLSS